MRAERLAEITGADFFTGVPDSQLRALCDYLMKRYGIDPNHHIIGANEGTCTAIAAGYHLATGRIPVVYMQNSGEGNIMNPVVSLLNDKVYGIPAIFIIGWRGEPGIPDEPQHIYQGQVTLKFLDDMGIDSFVIGGDTEDAAVCAQMEIFGESLKKGRAVAFVIRKGALESDTKVIYKNENQMNREAIISHITKISGEDPIISTTGKASRELFEIREKNAESHAFDFLTVGSMGHASSIALGVALNCPEKKIWCIDGDGAALMHMGAMGVIGVNKPRNLVHIVINNGAHESVGGMPTVADDIDLAGVASACGYLNVARADDFSSLDNALAAAKERDELSFIEVKSTVGARKDLGRPTMKPTENKILFMRNIRP